MRGLASIIALAMTLATSCSKESIPDAAVEQLDRREINFSAYSSTISTKAPVIDNVNIQQKGFNVGAYMPNSDLTAAGLYIPCTHVGYLNGGWSYLDENNDPQTCYWPALASQKLSFLAHYPKGIEEDMQADDGETTLFGNEKYEPYEDNLAFSFGYTVHHDAESQFDLIYALRENVACPDESPYTVHLPFCHALTQVGFTAELDPDLDVNITVYDVEIHNVVYTGTFVVKEDTSDFNNNGVWYYTKGATDAATGTEANADGYLTSEFGVAMVGDGSGVALNSTPQNLTSPDDALMLMPQHISAWDPTTFVSDDPTKAGAYLKISCEITQTVDNELITIHNKENWLYTPLTTNITYPEGTLENTASPATLSDWVAGYNITYNLKFGGGYSTIPGKANPVMTLTPIVINASVEAWDNVDGGELMTDDKGTE